MAKTRTGPTFIQRSRQVAPEQKALYHDELGAGRSRVKRPFFQLDRNDEQVLVEEIAKRLEARLGR